MQTERRETYSGWFAALGTARVAETHLGVDDELQLARLLLNFCGQEKADSTDILPNGKRTTVTERMRTDWHPNTHTQHH